MFESTYRKLLEAGVIKPGDRHTIEPDPQPAPGGFKGLNPETVAAAMGPTMTEMQGATPIKRNPEDFVEDFTFPHRMLETQAIMKEEEARRTRGLAQQALHTDREADVDTRVQKRAALEDRLDDLWNATECLAEDLQALDTDREAHAADDYPETVPCPAPAPLPPNPKQAYGDQKVPLHFVPAASLIHEAQAFREGARKYGPFNWRLNAVEAMTYIGAALRHLAAYADGEDFDPEIKLPTHHLGLAKACLGIVLDSLETGNLIDNRPPPGAAAALLRSLKVSGKAI